MDEELKRIEAHLASLTPPLRDALLRLREQIRQAAPEAEECVSYGMPAFRQNGVLDCYAGFKSHCSLFPMGSEVLDQLEDALRGFRVAKGTLHFTPERPLPDELVRRIVHARLAINERRADERRAQKRREC